ncbi:MAG: hypothetical protein N3A61_05810, partial [Ignavibacteria bacterium]|nr:hypothetical protein [Ignavibacteria bacterium]
FYSSWKSTQSKSNQILKIDGIKKPNKNLKPVFYVDDEHKIDLGYTYPLNSNFKDGILDLKSFELQENESHYFFKLKFRNLVDPGWHREYGFQLTFCAIAIQNESKPNRSTEIGFNSNYILEEDRAFHKLILVGGGVEIYNSQKKLIASYIPEEHDYINPLGNVKTGIINFSLSKEMIGKIKGTSKITILVGAQDDHGGAGIGEFRNVKSKASEWEGGGKLKPDLPNVYQILKVN